MFNIIDQIKQKSGTAPPFCTPTGQKSELYADMLNQPHLLIAGATGSGKSVIINGLIYTALYQPPGKAAGAVSLVLIDPKRVELVIYKDLPHVLNYADNQPDILKAFEEVSAICESRYKDMQRQKLRKYPGGDIYIIIDEFADLMTTQAAKIRPIIQHLAQIGRAAKIHIILATQTPISKVLPTEIKCNFDSRAALRTRSAQDSRNITGFKGCETLPRFGQCFYITPEKLERVAVPMYEEAELLTRVNWWNDQSRRRKFIIN